MADPHTDAPDTPAAPDGAAAPAAEADLAAQLAETRARADEFYDQFVRARAEMENIRRRAQDDIARAHKFALEGFAESLLPVRDSLEMALSVSAPTTESLREGVDATLRQLASAFEKHRIVVVDPVGERFDPNRHQAISAVPAAGTQPPIAAGHVVSVLQKGYLLNERVLRPALVVVAQ